MTETRRSPRIDQGTDVHPLPALRPRRPDGRASRQREHRQFYPRPGWVEHDAAEIWRNVLRVVPEALRGAGHHARRRRRASASPTSARPRWSGTGTPAGRWRTRDHLAGHPHRGRCRRWTLATRRRGGRRGVAGCRSASYFAAPAAALAARQRRRDCAQRPSAGDAALRHDGDLADLEPHRRRRRRRHVTDVTNASRTMLMDLATLASGTEAAGALRHPAPRCCPRSAGNAEVYGTCRGVLPGVPVARRARRPAGRAVRPDLLRRRARPSARTAPARSC